MLNVLSRAPPMSYVSVSIISHIFRSFFGYISLLSILLCQVMLIESTIHNDAIDARASNVTANAPDNDEDEGNLGGW